MTKRHFIALADILAAQKPGLFIGEWEALRDSLADFCKQQNPRFKRQLWLDYIDGKCGPSGGKLKKVATP